MPAFIAEGAMRFVLKVLLAVLTMFALLSGPSRAGDAEVDDPAMDPAAQRVGIVAHHIRQRQSRRGADRSGRGEGHQASIPSGLSISRLKACISRAPSAPSMAR